MTDETFRPDCARCAALCCIGLAFDRGPLFGYDKPAGDPCRHLGADDRCRIHAELDARGFGGCVAYDCLGAGQAVTQDLCGGRSWREDPALLAPMMAALAAIRRAHELILLLRQAKTLALPPPMLIALEDLEIRLMPEPGWTLADISSGAVDAVAHEARRFLTTLAPYAPARPQAGTSPSTVVR